MQHQSTFLKQTDQGAYKVRNSITKDPASIGTCTVRLSHVKTNLWRWALPIVLLLCASLAGRAQTAGQKAPFKFHLEEATIDDVHRAIKEGQISCHSLR